MSYRRREPTDTLAFDLPHRRPSFLLNTPALISHFMFRYDDADIAAAGDKSGDGSSNAAPDVTERINAFLDSVPHVDDKPHPRFTRDYAECARAARKSASHYGSKVFHNRTLSCIGVQGDGCAYDFLVDLHSEYFSISIRAYPAINAADDIGADRYDAKAPADDANDADAVQRPAYLHDVLTIIEDIYKKEHGGELEQRWLALRNAADLAERNDQGFDEQHTDADIETIFVSFWASFFDDKGFLNPIKFFASVPGITHAATFKGFVLRDQPLEMQKQSYHQKRRRNVLDRNVIASDVQVSVSDDPDSRHKIQFFDEINADGYLDEVPHKRAASWLAKFINRRAILFSRILGFRLGNDWIQDYRGGGAVLCQMLDGLALYGSAMGNRDAAGAPYGSKEVRYFVVYAGPSRNQLGRLVRRIHLCGESRIQGGLDYETIREMDRRIQQLQTEIQGAGSDVPQADRARFLSEFGEISNSVEIGLSKRIEKSLYYKENLEERMRELRVRAYEGWQPYTEFISRYVAPQFHSIASVKNAYDELEKSIRRLIAQSTVVEMRDQAGAIEGVMKSIAALQEHQTKITDDMFNLATTQRTLAEQDEKIRRGGERVQIVGGVLAPLVAGATVQQIYGPVAGIAGLGEEGAGYAISAAIVLALAAIIWSVRRQPK
ncbi:hypothetical protein AWH62_07720 [Maricaulis sp. W15]|uniref:DUF3422 family protein n=1 Tax=Maricaulis sp. W15 TaxID=1772333 RepID=UPI000949120D|nr:DUF3422 family protein [Maricaulis sp. W15]OLF74024.1 hypothetical protein AWH62_07720 [Maricaulis sp. W15]